MDTQTIALIVIAVLAVIVVFILVSYVKALPSEACLISGISKTEAMGVDMCEILKTKTLAAQTDRNVNVKGTDDVIISSK